MGAEINGGATGIGERAGDDPNAYGHVASSGLYSQVVRRGDEPLDAGFGLATAMAGEGPAVSDDPDVRSGEAQGEAETAWERYTDQKLEAILRGKPLPPDCTVEWSGSPSYAGEGPEPSFKRPGYEGTVAYEQDNSRPADDRMVPSIEWRETGTAPDRPDRPV